MNRRGEEHIPALDGIRGIAILLVLLVHFIPPVPMQSRLAEWAMKIFSTGGWVGVDLFFVLSGFLITGILLRTKDKRRYFINFYMRRTLRIFPLYFLALFIIFVVLPLFISTPRFTNLQDNQLYFWLYAGNIGMLAAGRDAMDPDVVSPAIYWSLAVEEHFYLIWPTVIFYCQTRTTKAVCLAIIAGALVIRCVGVLLLGSESMFFYLTPCRMDGLAAGALLATLVYERGISGLRSLIRPALVCSAFATGILVVFFLYMKGLWTGHWFMRTFGLSLLIAIFASLLGVAVASPLGRLSKFLDFSALRFFGKYSYGLYVIHALMMYALLALLPTRAWLSVFPNQPMLGALSLVAVKIAVCTVLAVASFHFYERPFLLMKRYFEPSQASPTVSASGETQPLQSQRTPA